MIFQVLLSTLRSRLRSEDWPFWSWYGKRGARTPAFIRYAGLACHVCERPLAVVATQNVRAEARPKKVRIRTYLWRPSARCDRQQSPPGPNFTCTFQLPDDTNLQRAFLGRHHLNGPASEGNISHVDRPVLVQRPSGRVDCVLLRITSTQS
jgi:hypothetical protein